MITGIIQQMHEGAEQIGSGSGCGTRDLDFLTEDKLTYEQLEGKRQADPVFPGLMKAATLS